jgi:arylsulfatase A-like enzyme
VDLAPTLIELALGAEQIPAVFEGQSFLATLLDPALPHREFAFAEDHWHDFEDHARAVMTQRFKLIRNDYPELPNTPPADAGRGPAWQAMLQLEAQGQLSEVQRGCFTLPRARWELYDLVRDPAELHNCFDDPAYRKSRVALQSALEEWSRRTADYLPSQRTPDEFDRQTGEPDNAVRMRPRKSKLEMFGTNGKY